ncbi:hypothetical protein PIB30_062855 [Stylosanthes scabra]|uniref:DUF4283 domain-containing protein n=1 Tax=Stylosanthes scabra TaxID=79078 RepID=A0ABU6ZJY4_9FABA|nr:hypothetical protein [Stylosanthes scabra]
MEQRTKEKGSRKVVEVVASAPMTDLLKRSIVAGSVKPIDFRVIWEKLCSEWQGPGRVQTRDLGPYKCILSFDSVENRDEALKSPVLRSLFDELRPQWGYSWSLSRRVWLEIVGIPVHLWSKDNIWNIGKLWGKPIMLDDTTEQLCSFSCARVLIDCYEWAPIMECVQLAVDGVQFEVYVKEFGREIYSAQSFPRSCPLVSLALVDSFSDNDGTGSGSDGATVPETAMIEQYSKVVEVQGTTREVEDGVISEWWDPLINDISLKRCVEGDINVNYGGWGGDFEFAEEILIMRSDKNFKRVQLGPQDSAAQLMMGHGERDAWGEYKENFGPALKDLSWFEKGKAYKGKDNRPMELQCELGLDMSEMEEGQEHVLGADQEQVLDINVGQDQMLDTRRSHKQNLGAEMGELTIPIANCISSGVESREVAEEVVRVCEEGGAIFRESEKDAIINKLSGSMSAKEMKTYSLRLRRKMTSWGRAAEGSSMEGSVAKSGEYIFY